MYLKYIQFFLFEMNFKGMWYLTKLKIHVNNLVQFLYAYVQITLNFVLKIWKMVEKMKTDNTTLDNEKIFFIHFTKIELFFTFWTKSRLSTSVFISSDISQIFKTKFYVFWTQACRNPKSIKFANLLSITCS